MKFYIKNNFIESANFECPENECDVCAIMFDNFKIETCNCKNLNICFDCVKEIYFQRKNIFVQLVEKNQFIPSNQLTIL